MLPEIQYDMFYDAEDYRVEEIKAINVKLGNLRRGLFKRHDMLEKKFEELFFRLEKIECRLSVIECAIAPQADHIGFDGTFKLQEYVG